MPPNNSFKRNATSGVRLIQALGPMKRKLAFIVILLALMVQPALASQTACMFSTDKATHYYEIEFVGYSDTDPMIVFSSTVFGSGKRFTLHPSNYTLEHFSKKARAVSLEFRSQEGSAMPPFTLVGTAGRASLKIGSNDIEGDLRCDF